MPKHAKTDLVVILQTVTDVSTMERGEFSETFLIDACHCYSRMQGRETFPR